MRPKNEQNPTPNTDPSMIPVQRCYINSMTDKRLNEKCQRFEGQQIVNTRTRNSGCSIKSLLKWAIKQSDWRSSRYK